MKVITICLKKSLLMLITANLFKFEITVNKHVDYYDFENTKEVVGDFFKNVCSRFKPSDLKLIKCSFVIGNIKQSAFEDLRPNLNTRYWTTDVYKATYFNDFVFYGQTQNVLSKLIVNSMSGRFSQVCNDNFKGFKFRQRDRNIK